MRVMAVNHRLLLVVLTSVLVAFLTSSSTRLHAFTLEQVMSAPYPTNLVAAERAERIAWVVNDRGVRNIWTAAAPDFVAQQLTSYSDDDGQVLGGLRLSGDGSFLIYVKGGGPNAKGEHPNPSHDPQGIEQAIWMVPTAGGEPRKLAVGRAPVVSPGGDGVVFARKGEVFHVDFADSDASGGPGRDGAPEDDSNGSHSKKPDKLFEARGNQTELTFSPDGKRLAFVSNRGDHSFVGVFDLDAKKLRWMAPDVGVDSSPVWSADGTQIAFLRRRGFGMRELANLTEGREFGVWLADPATGETRRIWKSPGADGGFAQWYLDKPLTWAADNRLIFTSEHDGWLHVYAVPAAGGAAVDLSPGAGDIESFAVTRDGAFVVYCSNHEDSPRRHLWRVPSRGGKPVPLTTGEGIETDPVPLAGDQWIAFRGSTARLPQQIAVVSRIDSSRRDISPGALPAEFPADHLVLPQSVAFQSGDNLTIHGQLFMPAETGTENNRPAVIFMHGGPIRQMLLGWHYRGYYANCYAFNQYLTNRGFVVLSVDYRSGIGYGRDFRQAPNQGPRGASEYQDIVAAAHFLRTLPEVDPARIGLWGGSYGGLLTAMALARDSDLFAAGVDLHGVHDWSYRGEEFPVAGGGWGLHGDELLEQARLNSPVADLDSWTSPALFVHGDDDRNVLFIQTTHVVEYLRSRGVEVDTLIFPDEVHGFLRHESWLRTFEAAAEFFSRHLGSPWHLDSRPF